MTAKPATQHAIDLHAGRDDHGHGCRNSEEPAAPFPPTVVSGDDDSTTDPDESTTSLKVVWHPPENTGRPVTDYNVEYKKSTETEFEDTGGGNHQRHGHDPLRSQGWTADTPTTCGSRRRTVRHRPLVVRGDRLDQQGGQQPAGHSTMTHQESLTCRRRMWLRTPPRGRTSAAR